MLPRAKKDAACADERRARNACRVPRPARVTRALTLAGAITLIGCGGPSFNGTIYRSDDIAFRVAPPPATWQRINVSQTALAFRDEPADATIAVSGRCGKDSDDVPLRSLTQHLFIQFTDREIEAEEIVPFDEREALHTVMVAKLDGVPKKFDVWVLKKDGCVYDLLYIARPSSFAAGVGPFRQFARGFSTVETDEN
jgi:hypothetical protein